MALRPRRDTICNAIADWSRLCCTALDGKLLNPDETPHFPVVLRIRKGELVLLLQFACISGTSPGTRTDFPPISLSISSKWRPNSPTNQRSRFIDFERFDEPFGLRPQSSSPFSYKNITLVLPEQRVAKTALTIHYIYKISLSSKQIHCRVLRRCFPCKEKRFVWLWCWKSGANREIHTQVVFLVLGRSKANAAALLTIFFSQLSS